MARKRRYSLGVRLTGWLRKQARTLAGGWKRRYYVLTHESLHRFHREKGEAFFGKEISNIALTEIEEVCKESNPPSGGNYCFSLRTKGGIQYLCAANNQEREIWVEALRSEIKICKSNHASSDYRRGTITGDYGKGDDDKDGKDTKAADEEMRVINISMECPGAKNRFVKGDVAWGQPVELGELPVTGGVVIVIILSDGGIVRLHQRQLEANPVASEETLPVVGGHHLQQCVVSLRWDGTPVQTDDRAGLWQLLLMADTAILPLALAVASSYFLYNAEGFSGRIVLWTLIMMVCLQMLLRSELVAYLTNTHHKLPGIGGGGAFNPNEVMQSMKDNRRTWKLSVMSWARTSGAAQHLDRKIGAAKEAGKAADGGGGSVSGAKSEGKAAIESQIDAADAAASNGESPSMRAFKASPAYERFMKSEPTTEKCLQRWLDTEKWRRDEGINDILEREHPHFDTVKKYFPHYWHGRTKNNKCVYIEQPGNMDMAKLRSLGITVDVLLHHFVYITEFCYSILEPSQEGRTFYILDMENVSFLSIDADVKEFLRRAIKICGDHYPERSFKTFIINTPWWFNSLWSLLRPFINAKTRNKIAILGGINEWREQLQEYVDADILPSEYGGKGLIPLGSSKEEEMLVRHVHRVNSQWKEHQAATAAAGHRARDSESSGSSRGGTNASN